MSYLVCKDIPQHEQPLYLKFNIPLETGGRIVYSNIDWVDDRAKAYRFAFWVLADAARLAARCSGGEITIRED
jgi:hypothetical protein